MYCTLKCNLSRIQYIVLARAILGSKKLDPNPDRREDNSDPDLNGPGIFLRGIWTREPSNLNPNGPDDNQT
jgi:hypothetical protein